MDFGELLHTAKRNDQAKPQVQYYSTKFAPPKKEHRAKTVSINVQKFLARKEAEEKEKREEALERKNKLLALRSQDKKATRRVNVMLKRTKSANQAVIADALDSDNTAVTLAGPSQPDEDDYGYVSQESSALYNKMMEKYSKMPEEPKFPTGKKIVSTNLSSTKDRVKAALEREREEALLPHRRKRKHADSGGDTEKPVEKHEEPEPEPEPERKEVSKPKFKPAPLVNFSDLLKLAEKKQFEPVVIETKKEEEERPLTKKQKKEFEREREWRERKESQKKAAQEKTVGLNRIPKINSSTSQSIQKIPKKVSFEHPDSRKMQGSKEVTSEYQNIRTLDKNSNIAKTDKISRLDVNMDKKQALVKPELVKKSDPPQKLLNGLKSCTLQSSEKPKVVVKSSNQMPPPKSKVSFQNEKFKVPQLKDVEQRKHPSLDGKPKQSFDQNTTNIRQFSQNNLKPKQLPTNELKPKQFPPKDLKSKQFSPNDLKPKQFPPNGVKPKQFPPNDLKPKQLETGYLKPKQLPPPDVRRNFPPKDVKRKPMPNKRRIIDDEYDSEMDDFIDDGPEDEQDYSKYISEIFGYDKRSYQYDDDDVDNMETSFAQQMKEEVISTKIGIMEDLEDMRQEEEAKKRKLIMKNSKKM